MKKVPSKIFYGLNSIAGFLLVVTEQIKLIHNLSLDSVYVFTTNLRSTPRSRITKSS